MRAPMVIRVPLLCLLVCLLAGCYEERSGCLDPDASNYDLLADLACPDCCTYPELSVRVTSVWQDSALVAGRAYTDGAGNRFLLQRFRYYLGDLRLRSTTGDLPFPVRPVAIASLEGTDTIAGNINGNYLLASASVSTTVVGSLQSGDAAINGLLGTYGLPDRFRNLIPNTAPATDALRTQPGRLNFRDGRGYVQSRLEYALPLANGDTTFRSVNSYGSVPFELGFGTGVTPLRGANLRLNLEARLSELLGTIDLSQDSSSIADDLNGPASWLYPISITQ